jgi:hypothetical protein
LLLLELGKGLTVPVTTVVSVIVVPLAFSTIQPPEKSENVVPETTTTPPDVKV